MVGLLQVSMFFGMYSQGIFQQWLQWWCTSAVSTFRLVLWQLLELPDWVPIGI